MKLPRRQFLRLAAGAAAVAYVPHIARARTLGLAARPNSASAECALTLPRPRSMVDLHGCPLAGGESHAVGDVIDMNAHRA